MLTKLLIVVVVMSGYCGILLAESGEELKQVSDFANWPGKGGPLKKGFAFNLADYPALANFKIIRDGEYTLDSDGIGVTHGIFLVDNVNDKKGIGIGISVACGSTDNAHKLLLNVFSSSNAVFSQIWRRGDTNGVAIGDFNFIRKMNPTSPPIIISFVRNNVAVDIGDHDSGVDIQALATAIDDKIKAQKDLTVAQFDALRPTITQFSPVADTIHWTARDSTTTLNIAVSDPSSEPVVRKIETDDGKNRITLVANTDPPKIQATSQTGTFPVKLIAINKSLQFQTVQTNITVAE
jgi:hypothetical protein